MLLNKDNQPPAKIVKTSKQINDLYAVINTVTCVDTRHKLLRAADTVNQADKNRRRIMVMIQEALEKIRLDMKYLIFDLEATRRERDEALGK